MTKLMQTLMDEVAKLPDADQDSFARAWLEELRDEQGWDRRFHDRPEVLAALLAEAEADIAAGRTAPLDFKRRR